jgi:hypothetical protein
VGEIILMGCTMFENETVVDVGVQFLLHLKKHEPHKADFLS